MKDRDDSQTDLTRRQLLSMATLAGAGLAAASMGAPEAEAAETKAAAAPQAWHETCRQGGVDRSGTAVNAQDRGQSGRHTN
jgi:nitrous oxide reductase